MQPNSEPTQADVASVAETLGQSTQPTPQMQPADPTPQPAPTQQPTDPFATLFASEPTAPTEEPAPQPTQPTEPMTPQPSQPVEPTQPAPQAEEEYQTYEEYMNSITANVPADVAKPNPDDIDANDPEAIKGFFDDLVNTAVQKSQNEIARKNAIQGAEKQAWETAFDKYGSLRTNKNLRDMVHSIRMGYFNRGVAMTPSQAADRLISSLSENYKQGVADQQVVTTYQDVQPNGGNSGAPVQTTLDKDTVLQQVQDGGESALANYLDSEVKAGRL